MTAYTPEVCFVIWLNPERDKPPADTEVLVIWGGKVTIAVWVSEFKNWQESPDGDFACSPNEVSRWCPRDSIMPHSLCS
jgi:hypothetical protein